MPPTDRRSGSRTYTRPSATRAALVVLLVWALAVAFVLVVASDTRIGPVVFRLTKTHGIHLGDIYATLASGVVAMLITVWIIVDHLGRKRRWLRAKERAARWREEVERRAVEGGAEEGAAEDEYANPAGDAYADDGYYPGYDGAYDHYGTHDAEHPADDPHERRAAVVTDEPDIDPETIDADVDADTVRIERPARINGRHRAH
ncbi:hypothetical protein SAMN05443637_12168 [Pseudonocardia thermophila]|jgi:hypothetical protein|uniref:Lipopolysaccharide assembly protein A domain-containing protein n=1 Tax=Pseudonocardia thermophila TaxID=1848 RepID=A0A1M6YUD4_PSETH|nr:hypothetical protein [Pseudonocardia thermophila]SHL21682.1 hypothetical protein SAMN05443637_12168 [Pseudonocardia thermophila]